MARVFISAGHYALREGATFRSPVPPRSYHTEHDLTQTIAAYAEAAIKATYNRTLLSALDVVRVPERELSHKVACINALCLADDVAIDVHLDARPLQMKADDRITGASALVHADTDRRVTLMLKEWCGLTGQKSRGVKERPDLAFTSKTNCHAVVFELGFGDDAAFCERCILSPDVLGGNLAASIIAAYRGAT